MKAVARRRYVGISLVAAMIGFSGFAYSQSVKPRPVSPTVLTGPDVGFRMVARKGATPVGQLVVRVDGEWQEVEFSYGVKLLTK